MEKIISEIKNKLNKKSNKSKIPWMENYIKHDSVFIGVYMPDIRKVLLEVYKEYKLNNINSNDKLFLSMSLFKEKISEYKLFAILLLQKFMQDGLNKEILIEHISDIFDKKYITDWNVCDWLCIKILAKLIENSDTSPDTQFDKIVLNWIDSPYYWKQRASVVSFTILKDKSKYKKDLLANCKILIARDEKFAKTAAGWILRELFKTYPKDVMNFLQENAKYLIPEVVANALEKMPNAEKKLFKLTLKRNIN